MAKEGMGYFYLLNTILFFSTYEVVSKTLDGKIDPFQINFIRFLVGGLILLAFIAVKRDFKIGSKDLLWVTVIGVINVTISMNLLQLSLYAEYAKASVVAVIFSSNPIFVFLFSVLIEKEKIKLYKIVGLFLGVCGIVVVSLEKLDFDLLYYKSPLLALLSAVFYGGYTVLGKRVSVRIGSLKMNAYSFILGSLFLLPFLILFDVPVIRFDYTGMYQVLYLSVCVTGIAYLTYFKGLARIGTSKGSLVFFIKPVLASILAIGFLKEEPSANLYLGTACILAGIVMILYWKDIQKKIHWKS